MTLKRKHYGHVSSTFDWTLDQYCFCVTLFQPQTYL